MLNKIEKNILILFCVYSLFFFLGSSLAPIMAHFHQYNISAYLSSLYINSCHQQPDRSFWILGYPIALCCRCYGFYLGVVFSAVTSLLNKFRLNIKTFALLLVF